jgi:hypothetical protein
VAYISNQSQIVHNLLLTLIEVCKVDLNQSNIAQLQTSFYHFAFKSALPIHDYKSVSRLQLLVEENVHLPACEGAAIVFEKGLVISLAIGHYQIIEESTFAARLVRKLTEAETEDSKAFVHVEKKLWQILYSLSDLFCHN